MVRDGAFEISHRNVALDILSRGAVFGHPSLLTGMAPEFTTRAREDSAVYCIPGELALDILSRTDGVVFVAKTLRDRLIQTARTVGALTGVRARTVRSMLHGAPEFCTPETPDLRRPPASWPTRGSRRSSCGGPEGLGIVTDVDLRDKVVAVRASGDTPVGAIMSTPVQTIGAEVFASEASIHMMEAGVNHLPVLDGQGEVLGVLSASSLMSMDALSPFALRHFIMGAATVEEVGRVGPRPARAVRRPRGRAPGRGRPHAHRHAAARRHDDAPAQARRAAPGRRARCPTPGSPSAARPAAR